MKNIKIKIYVIIVLVFLLALTSHSSGNSASMESKSCSDLLMILLDSPTESDIKLAKNIESEIVSIEAGDKYKIIIEKAQSISIEISLKIGCTATENIATSEIEKILKKLEITPDRDMKKILSNILVKTCEATKNI